MRANEELLKARVTYYKNKVLEVSDFSGRGSVVCCLNGSSNIDTNNNNNNNMNNIFNMVARIHGQLGRLAQVLHAAQH